MTRLTMITRESNKGKKGVFNDTYRKTYVETHVKNKENLFKSYYLDDSFYSDPQKNVTDHVSSGN